MQAWAKREVDISSLAYVYKQSRNLIGLIQNVQGTVRFMTIKPREYFIKYMYSDEPVPIP